MSRHGGIARLRPPRSDRQTSPPHCGSAAARRDGPVAGACFRAVWEVLFRRGPACVRRRTRRPGGGDAGAPPRLAAQVRIGLAVALRRCGRSDDARALLDGALALARATGEAALGPKVLHNVGLAQASVGDVESALLLQREALATFVAAGDRMMQGNVLANLGNLMMDSGHPVEGIDCYERALALHREVGNRRGEGIALCNLGAAHFDLGHLAEARDHLAAALAIDRETGSRTNEGITLTNLANLEEQESRLDEALECDDRARDLSRDRRSARRGHRAVEHRAHPSRAGALRRGACAVRRGAGDPSGTRQPAPRGPGR